MPARKLPSRPDLRQLRHQAKDLLRAFQRGDPSAIADFADHHPQRLDATTARLGRRTARSRAQLRRDQLAATCRRVRPDQRGRARGF